MPRTAVPKPDEVPADSKPTLDTFTKKIGFTPNMMAARKVIETRGKVNDADLRAVRDAGYTDADVMEIIALVAMYSLTNFFNNVFDPEKDFPAVMPAGSI